jgi:hypothetical protein
VPRTLQAASLFLCAALASPPAIADIALLSAMDACIADIAARDEEELAGDSGDAAEAADADADEGGDADAPELSELELFCPEVHAGLDDSPLAAYLEPDWENRISASKLERLRALLAADAPSAGRVLDTASLAGIMQSLEDAQVRSERSLWQRFKDWLRQVFEQQAMNAQESDWLDAWLREHWPSERVMRAIALGILALVLGGLAWIVYVELRAAGIIGRQRRSGMREGPLAANDGQPRAQALGEGSDERLPGTLVELLLTQLRRLGRVQDRLSMTHRELGHAVRLDTAAEREVFFDLLRLSERVRYAPGVPAAASVHPVMEGARLLLEALRRQAATPA